MLKKLLLISILLQPSTVIASERIDFYEKKISQNWTVSGVKYTDGSMPGSCFLRRGYEDGSAIEINFGLDQLEYIWINLINRGWKIDPNMLNTSPDAKAKVYDSRFNLIDTKGSIVQSADVSYMLFPALDNKYARVYTQMSMQFFDAIAESNAASLKIVFMGNLLQNVSITFDGIAKKIPSEIANCVKSAKAKGFLNYKKQEQKPTNKGMGA